MQYFILFLIIFSIFWSVCSILSYGFSLAYFQKEFPDISKDQYLDDICFSLRLSILGPVSLSVIIQEKGYVHGLKFF